MKVTYNDDYHKKCRANSKAAYEKDKSVKQIYYLKNKLNLRDEDVAEFDNKKDLLIYLQKLSIKRKYGFDV
jgi:hypothetical protein